MKKHLLLLLLILPLISTFSQEEEPFDGFGSEGNGDAQTNAPNVPIDGLEIPLLITGICIAIVLLRNKEEQIKTN